MMSHSFKPLRTAHSLLNRVLQPVSIVHPVRGKKRQKFRKPLDPEQAEDLPEYEFAGKTSSPDTLLFTWGVADHGGLGRASFVRPDTSKRQHHMPYVHHPHRVEFGEYHKFWFVRVVLIGHTSSSQEPLCSEQVRVPRLEGQGDEAEKVIQVVDVACGYGYTVFAVHDRSGPTCYGTGINSDSQIGTHEPRSGYPLGMLINPAPIELPLSDGCRVTKVASGRAHTVMLTDKEGVWSTGNNAYGQCGRPIIPDEDYGKKAFYHRITALDDTHVTQVECGQDTSFFLSEDGVVYSCGWGADGQTGRGHYDNEPNVGAVVGDIAGEKIVKVSCRADCALALSDKGDVFGWGNSEYHQLNSVTEEMQIHTSKKLSFPGIKKIIDIASAGTMCLLLCENGQVYSWGFGPIGKGPAVTYSKNPTLIPPTLFGQNELTPDSRVISVACGINQFAVINNHGSLFTWGKNPGGCLGQSHIKDQYFPIRVCIGGQVLKVSCGVDHMAAMVRENV